MRTRRGNSTSAIEIACERNSTHAFITDKFAADITSAVDDLEQTLWQARSFETFGKQETGIRRPLGGLENDGATRGKRVGDFVRGKRAGEFHGTMTTATPSGLRSTSTSPCGPGTLLTAYPLCRTPDTALNASHTMALTKLLVPNTLNHMVHDREPVESMFFDPDGFLFDAIEDIGIIIDK